MAHAIIAHDAHGVIFATGAPHRRSKTEAESRIDALLAERAGYVARGLTERVELVDQALARAGYDGGVSTEAKAASEPSPPSSQKVRLVKNGAPGER